MRKLWWPKLTEVNYKKVVQISCGNFLIFFFFYRFRYFGIPIIDDEERAWFPAEDLRDFHGIEPRPVSAVETVLFCTRPDGTEGCCWPGCCETDDEE